MKTKICTKCGIEKPSNEFYLHKATKDKLGSYCKNCFKKYREENKKRIAKNQKKWREKNKGRDVGIRNDYCKKYYQNNKEKMLGQSKKWREKNKEKMKEMNKKWREKNELKLKEDKKNYAQLNRKKILEYITNNKIQIDKTHYYINTSPKELKPFLLACIELKKYKKVLKKYNKIEVVK